MVRKIIEVALDVEDALREELDYCDPLPMTNPYRKSEEESEEFQDIAGLDYGDEAEYPDDDEGNLICLTN